MIYFRAAITKVWSLWFDGEMMRINEIRLQIFLLNLNEKIYKPIFAKRICPKYLQNLQMVLSMLCNGEKTCKKFELFRYKCILKSYCLIQFFFAKEPLMSTEQIFKKLLTSFDQEKFVPSSFSNRFLYQTTWVNCFESCKESKLVNSVLSKGDLSFTY